MRRTAVVAAVLLLTGATDTAAQDFNEQAARSMVGCYSITEYPSAEWDFGDWDGDPGVLPPSPVALELRARELSPQPPDGRLATGTPYREAVALSEDGEPLELYNMWRVFREWVFVGLPELTSHLAVRHEYGRSRSSEDAYVTHLPTEPDGPQPMKRFLIVRVQCPRR